MIFLYFFCYITKHILPVEHLLELLYFQCFQISLATRIVHIWDFLVGIFARKAMINVGWVLSPVVSI